MKVLIIEDEPLAAKRLIGLLNELDPGIQVLEILDSIEDTVKWLHENPHPELIFMDIMLADGQSFQIFESIHIKVPIIFTTAYDEFAIKAFKVNSIDYLLKPIEPLLLEAALKKHHSLIPLPENFNAVMELLLQNAVKDRPVQQAFKNRFLVKRGDKFIPIAIAEIAYFSFKDKLSFLNTFDGNKYMLEHTLDELEKIVNPNTYFRLNRQYIMAFSCIKVVHNYFNGRLKVYVEPDVNEGIIVSKERAQAFKSWLNR